MRDAVICASQRVSADRHKIDALNVFPVPDGDTGTNMSMTMQAAVRELQTLTDEVPVSLVGDKTASALLRGARGNSGVILSLIFRGFTKGLHNCITADGADLARALELGTSSAYQAVMTPTEGTILTVVRHATAAAKAHAAFENDPVCVMQAALDGAKEALAHTPDLLPVLKKAGVVDAGGQGLVTIFESMLAVFKGDKVDIKLVTATRTQQEHKTALEEIGDGEILYTYCTEFILTPTRESLALRTFLQGMGDSLVFVADADIIKVHVHTNEPMLVMQEALLYGTLVHIKVENMRHQHTSAVTASQPEPEPEPQKTCALVAVAAGAGQEELFRQLGADAVVSGGQTMNPSTQEILDVITQLPARQVVVLPNNKNIIMTAQQAAQCAQKPVCVLPTKTIAQGIAAAMLFDGDSEAAANLPQMRTAAAGVKTGLVTYAVRDSEAGMQAVKQGDILGLAEDEIVLVEKDAQTAALRITRHLVTAASEAVTVLYGQDVTPAQAERLQTALQAQLGEQIDVTVINGGQPVYSYIVCVE